MFDSRIRRNSAEALHVCDTNSSAGDGPAASTDGDQNGAPEVTEDGIARLFTTRYGRQLRYDHDADTWFKWTGDRWQRETTGLAYSFCRELAREASNGARGKLLSTARRASFAAGVERMARTDRAHAVTQAIWDRDPMLLGAPGGTLDLRTGVVRRPDPADFITRQVTIAPAANATCPRWLAFLDEVTGGDAEMIRFLQQWCGYCLTGETVEHALAFVYGRGKNGKSVFLNTIAGIMGDYAAVASMETFTASRSDRHPTDRAMLHGARLATASETDEGRAWAEARIKQMTGGDPISARFMRCDFFTYRPQFKLTIVGNHRPVLQNVDEAARRRFNIIPFTRTPGEPDARLEEKLRAEWAGILRWMVDGCLDWLTNGLIRPAVVAETDSYFEEQDVFGQWLEEECVTDLTNPHRWETSNELYASWRRYAESGGEPTGSKKAFGDRMAARGYISCRPYVSGRRQRAWSGLSLAKREQRDESRSRDTWDG